MTDSQIRPGGDKELRVHDGIVGGSILLCVIVGMQLDPLGFWLAGLISAVMFSSAFTGFCPVHYTLSKLMRV
jgi:hypothetical protein